MSRHVFHAIDLDQRKRRQFVVGPLRKREIEQFEYLGMVGKTGELVFVGRACRLYFPQRKFMAGAPQLPQRQTGKSRQNDCDNGNKRCQAFKCLRRRRSLVPGEEPDDAAVRVHHWMHLATAGAQIAIELEIVHASNLCGQAHQAWIDFALAPGRHGKFGDGIAQCRVLLRRQLLVISLSFAVADR